MTKTCVECRYMLHKDTFEVCTHSMTNTSMFNEACKYFEPKVITNGDKIRQLSNAELADFLHDAADDIVNNNRSVDDILAWLNAPAESEEKDE